MQKICYFIKNLLSIFSKIILIMIILTCISLYFEYMFPELVFIRKICIAINPYINDFLKFIDEIQNKN